LALNQQQRKQQAEMSSAKARRLKFLQKVGEVIDAQRDELNESEAQGGDYTIDDICDKIKGAIYDELILL
jgi:hypothetical protein